MHPTHILVKMEAQIDQEFKFLRINRGISFCHVLKKQKLIQDRPLLISGNQKWKGKTPSFVSVANLISSSDNHWEGSHIFKKNPNKRVYLAIDWIIKYFIILLTESSFWLNRIGINIIILISNLIHIWNQELEE